MNVRDEAITAAALIGVVVSLLLVGVVSGTMLRHVVQIAPVVAAILVVIIRPQWTRYAAAPVLLFWLFIMVLIWLFLLGLARVVTGQYTPVEVVLTLTIGIACSVGLWAVLRSASRVPGWFGLAVFLTFAALQVGAMWLSLQPAFATR